MEAYCFKCRSKIVLCSYNFLIINVHSTEENKEGLWKHIALNADPKKKSKMLRQ